MKETFELACKNGNTDIVKECLEKGIDPNTTFKSDTYGVMTGLLYAVKNGYEDIVDLLISYKADVNYSIPFKPYKIDRFGGYTALHFAAVHGHFSIVKKLVENGAKIDTFTQCGITPLMNACNIPYIEIIEYLIRQGADVNTRQMRDENHKYAHECSAFLMITRKFGRVADILINAGADIHVIDAQRETALTNLILADQQETIIALDYLLKKGLDIDHQNYEGMTALMIQTEIKNEKVARFLLSKGADYKTLKNKKGQTAWDIAQEISDVKDVFEPYIFQEELDGLASSDEVDMVSL